MPGTTAKRTSTPATKATPKESTPVETKPTVEPVLDTTADAETEETSSPIQTEVQNLIEMAKNCMNIVQNFVRSTRAIAANIKKLERDVKRLDKKNRRSHQNRASNGNKGLQQPKPVYTAEMRTFFESNKSLTDNDGQPIVSDLVYDSEHLLVSRKQALKLVTSYIRSHNLQDQTDKRKINMDSTLQSLFPELWAVKDKKGKVLSEENCKYNTLMAALSRHFDDPKNPKPPKAKN